LLKTSHKTFQFVVQRDNIPSHRTSPLIGLIEP
jgi:hypothetical protein